MDPLIRDFSAFMYFLPFALTCVLACVYTLCDSFSFFVSFGNNHFLTFMFLIFFASLVMMRLRSQVKSLTLVLHGWKEIGAKRKKNKKMNWIYFRWDEKYGPALMLTGDEIQQRSLPPPHKVCLHNIKVTFSECFYLSRAPELGHCCTDIAPLISICPQPQ